MPLTFRHNVVAFSFFICTLFTRMSDGQRPCSLRQSQCMEVHYCPSARIAIRLHGSHDLQRCGWNHLTEKVCCTDSRSGGTGDISEEKSNEDVSIWPDDEDDDDEKKNTNTVTPSIMENSTPGSRDTVRKTEAACARYSVGVPIKINWHILGGESAKSGEFPHMAALGYKNTDPDSEDPNLIAWNCAGSLISDKFVLTAAHCVRRTKPVVVRVGALRINQEPTNGSDYNIENITTHPEYVRKTGRNDIALIQIEVVTFGENVHPACLYTRSDTPLGLVITGWGKLFFGQETRSDILQKARVSGVALDECNKTYVQRLNRPLGDGQLCAGPADSKIPTDSCPGDSGGPLQVFTSENVYAVVGIISFGITDCGGDAPSVYTRAYHYLDWIEGIVWPQ